MIRYSLAILPLVAVMGADQGGKSLVETDDAYILEADLPEKDTKAATATKTGTSTRLFTGNQAIDGAVVGLGVGVIGSLLVGKLLEEKNKCNPRGRRDTASTRFLPGLFGGNNCPPPPYHQPGYQQPNTGYQHPNSAYQQPNQGYRPSNNYQQPSNGYHQPTSGYQQPNTGYQRPNSAYQQPNQGYRPSNNYHQPSNGYSRPNAGYQQPASPGYNPGYQQPHRSQQSGFSQASAHKPTPATFSAGLPPVHAPASGYQSPQPQPSQGYRPGILGRSLHKNENSKVNF